MIDLLRKAFRLGFEASGEGYNGEYPFEGYNVDEDEEWCEMRDEALARLAAPVAAPVQEWQDISTAPKDWSDILLFDPEYPNDHHKVFQGYYDPDENDWLDAQNVVAHPTHWQPLPTPPALRALSGDTSNG